MREENKIRLMVVPIAAMLVVTMFTAGNQQVGEQELDVEEGYDEITVIVPPKPEGEPNKKALFRTCENATAMSHINGNKSYLQIDVHPYYWGAIPPDNTSRATYYVGIFVSVEANLESEYDPKALRIESRVLGAPKIDSNHINWHTSDMDNEDRNNLNPWPASKMSTGVQGDGCSYIGYDIKGNNFATGDTKLRNEHPSNYSLVDSPITIEIKGVLKGLSKDVEATVNLSFTQEEV